MADTGNTVTNGPVVRPVNHSLQSVVQTPGKTPLGIDAFSISVDGVTILGSGGAQDPLRAAGTIGGNRQTFQYVWLGTENPAGFPIALPAARANANYTADVTCGITAGGVSISFALSAKSATQFTAVPSSAGLTAGDILQITVQDLT